MSHALVDEVRSLLPRIRELAEQVEHERAVPEDLVEQLAATGVFRLAAPPTPVDPVTMFEAFEELGRADGSVGWCAMIAGATSVALGYLDEATAADLLDDPRFLIAGVAAPTGRAREVPGGYAVTGRWSFASGCRQSTWLVGGCVVLDGDRPADPPRVLHVVVPTADVTIHDTWHVTGLRGTGSHDIELIDQFVPAERTFSLFHPALRDGPLFAFPVFGLLALGIGAVACGIARAALEEFTRLGAAKLNPATGQPVAAKPTARTAFAEASALLGGGRSYLVAMLDECWESVLAGEDVSLHRRARLRLAIAHAVTSAARAVDLVYAAAGGTSIYTSSPLQRHFRDIHVAAQHAMVNADLVELAGAVLLDQPVPTVRL